MNEPVITIDTSDKVEFEALCAKAVAEGYKLKSCDCGFLDSESYNFCSSYQAIFVKPEALA